MHGALRGVPAKGVGAYWRAAMPAFGRHTPCGAGYVGSFVPPYAAPIAPEGALPPSERQSFWGVAPNPTGALPRTPPKGLKPLWNPAIMGVFAGETGIDR
jgi:hypothetical protein